MTSKFKGYTLGVIAAATYGMNPLFTLPLYKEGMDPNSVLFFRYLMALPIVAVMIKARRRDFCVNPRQLLPLSVLGLLMGLSSLALFVSYNYMEASIASTMLFVYPIMVALIMAVVYHEKLTLQTVICLTMAIAGIILLYNGNGNATLSAAGTAWVMVSSLSYSIYIVGVNRSELKNLPTIKLTFYILLAGFMIFAIKAAISGHLAVPHTTAMWAEALALAALPTAVSLICTTVAIQYIGSTATAILGVFEPVTAVIFGVLVFDEVLTAKDTAGLLLILVAVTLVVSGSNIHRPLMAVRKMFPKAVRKRL